MTEVKKVQIKVSPDIWEKLQILKGKLRARSHDEVLRQLIHAYESGESYEKGEKTLTSELEDALFNGLVLILNSLRFKLHSYRPVLILLGDVVKVGELDYKTKKKELEKEGFDISQMIEHVKEYIKVEDDKLTLTQPFKLMLDVCEMVKKGCKEEFAEGLLR